MSIQKWSEQIWVTQLADEPAFSDDMAWLRDETAKAEQMPDLVLDLSGVDHVNSSQLAQLLRLRKIVADRKTRLRLAGPPDSVWAVFLATGLDKVFDFSENVTTALAELQMQR